MSPISSWPCCWGCVAWALPKAASALQARALIHYHRGDVTVLDRAGLQGAACGCYGAAEALYEQGLG